MIAAETLGVPLASLRAVAGDTEVAPYDGGSYGNRVLYSTGRAVDAAARDCLGQILATAAPMLKAASGDLELRNGVVRVKSDTSRSLPLKEVMTRRGRSIVGDGSVAQSQAEMNVERAAGAHFVEVEVDRETGKIRILTYISAHDVGQPINITVVENQIEGGTIQGLALTQAEEMRFDPRDGRCLNANFLDLKPPTMLDFDPRVIESVVIDNVGEQGPYGAKGLGENPCHPGMAAVANAIYNAVGIRLRRVPFTRADVLRALAEPRSVPSRTATGPAEAGQDVRGVRL
jgi:xanthine dehydrogenase molybdenum-binding subunit